MFQNARSKIAKIESSKEILKLKVSQAHGACAAAKQMLILGGKNSTAKNHGAFSFKIS